MRTSIKIAAFVGTLCASGALVATAVTGTGAYFTDSKSGSVNASTGKVVLDTGNLDLNFTNLLPGEFQTNTINYTARGTGSEDVWLVLPTDGSAVAFNGGPGTTALGRYGHFAVDSATGSFTSYNLTTGSNGCPIDSNGHGGSDQQAADKTDLTPYCGVPNAILLSSGLNYNDSGTANITFGYTKLLRSGQGAASAPVAKFKIVATQHGVRPDDVNNPA